MSDGALEEPVGAQEQNAVEEPVMGGAADAPAKKPEFLPDQYWVNGEVDLAGLVDDSKRYRAALSKHSQAVPSEASGYVMKDFGLPEEAQQHYAAFAHKLGLSQYQVEQMFGEAGKKLSEDVEAYYRAERAEQEREEESKYIGEQVELFGGREKVKRAVERMDNLFTTMKNRGMMDDDEIAAFKHSTFKTATSMKGFEKVMNLIDSINNEPTVNASASPTPTAGSKYAGLERDAVIRSVIEQRHRAQHRSDHDDIYRSLGGVKI